MTLGQGKTYITRVSKPSSLWTVNAPRALVFSALGLLGACLGVEACSSSSSGKDGAAGGAAGTGATAAAGSGGASGEAGAGALVTPSPVVISAKVRTPVTTTRSINYWMWSPTYGDDISGTEKQVAPLGFELMRIGGYNNDANTPDPFDDAQLDRAVAYAKAIGAEPILQVPLLADTTGLPPTADTAAEMVSYANLTKKYGIKYVSIGNEPDLYATQGSLADMSKPAIPNYRPEDYCASVKAYVAAMKAVEPSLTIVGPELAYQYTANANWFSPVLKACGDQFDIVTIHRYPFAAAMTSLNSVKADVDSFRSTIASVRGLMKEAGYGDKPLAITEMNVDYDALPASNVPLAAAGTVPSALWLADILGAAQELSLRTTALWDISDDPSRKFGIIDVPPDQTPRPQYYAFQLFAEHSGPTLLSLTSAPKDVHAYPTRNAADDGTDVVVTNWLTAAQVLEFQVTDLDSAPDPVVFTLPGLSLAAIEIPDHGAPKAFSYGFAEHAASTGPSDLAPGVGQLGDIDAGVNTSPDAGFSCPTMQLASNAVTTMGTGDAGALSFGPDANGWASFTYQGPSQTAPVVNATSDGNGFEMKSALTPPLSSNNYAGFGIYYNSGSCLDASHATGVELELSGDLGDCSLRYILFSSQNLSYLDDPSRGGCHDTDSVCLGAYVPLAVSTDKIRIPFTLFAHGTPVDGVDPRALTTMQWQVSAADASKGCSADFTVKNLGFY